MKYFLIAGEPSGDLHGSNIMRELKKLDPQADFCFTGGDLMQAVGGRLVRHYRHMSFMGIFTVLANIGKVMENFRICKKEILAYKPDVLFLIDYPGFNLRMARWAKKNGIRVFMYVSPTVWAWKEGRVKTIMENIERLFVILPFEADFYKTRHNHEVYYTSNPIFDVVESYKEKNDVSKFRAENGLSVKPIVALLSGSRRQEIKHCLPVMLSLVNKYPEYQFVIAGASSLPVSIYEPYLQQDPSVKIVHGKTYELLMNSFSAIVTSGTATLETALINVPEIVIYKAGLPNYLIGKALVKLKFFSLVNLILGRMAVKELLQIGLEKRLAAEAPLLFKDEKYREKIFAGYKELRSKLERGAYKKTAGLAWQFLKTKNT
jgi:lipid-A-disaccharide synthase